MVTLDRDVVFDPHMRGEYEAIKARQELEKGSPPHAWGIRPLGIVCLVALRITPTCVGNTFQTVDAHGLYRDHPHMRGEYTPPTAKRSVYEGSPPHAWGILIAEPTKATLLRITPTCVGNTA